MREPGGEGVEAEQRSSADLLLVDDPEEAEEEIGFNDIRMIFDDDDEDDFGKEEEQKEEEVQVEEDVQKEEQVEKEEEEEKEEQVEKEGEVEVEEEGNLSRDVDLEEVELSNNLDFLLFDELNEQRYFGFKAFSVLQLYCPLPFKIEEFDITVACDHDKNLFSVYTSTNFVFCLQGTQKRWSIHFQRTTKTKKVCLLKQRQKSRTSSALQRITSLSPVILNCCDIHSRKSCTLRRCSECPMTHLFLSKPFQACSLLFGNPM